MISRKELKIRGKRTLRKNHLRAVVICLIMVVFCGAYAATVSDFEVFDNVTNNSNSGIMNSFIDNNIGKEIKESSMFKNATEGVFATLFNNTTKSGSFLFGVLNSINQLFFNNKILAGVILLIGSIVGFLYWMFVGNILRVGECRFFLESRIYNHTEVNRILFIYKIRRTLNTAVIMFFRTFYIILWFLTVVGGFIKIYSYRLIPYILAENPNINMRDAFRLSIAMMKGNKWKAFKLDVSFFFWEILSYLSLGLTGYVYSNPYKRATSTEFYKELRDEAIKNKISNIELLNDIYLYNSPKEVNEHYVRRYPVDKFSIKEAKSRKWITTDYRRSYSIYSIILLFFSFGIVGWIWEVLLMILESGEFINRGALFGPWLPIYGAGGVLCLLLLKKYRDRPLLTFSLVLIICAIVEYGTGLYLETTKGMKWWDYSHYLFNFHGRVSLEGLLVFGLGGCASVYLISPILDDRFKKIPSKIKLVICIILLVLFSFDLTMSTIKPNQGNGITISINNNVFIDK